jgi:hypothetical protein
MRLGEDKEKCMRKEPNTKEFKISKNKDMKNKEVT